MVKKTKPADLTPDIPKCLEEEHFNIGEEKLRIIASHTPDHIIMQDCNLRYTYVVNPQLGLTEADMIGKTDMDLIDKENAERITAVKLKVMETRKPQHYETALQNLKGETEFFEGSYIPILDANGNSDGLIGYFRNVTERKRAEQIIQDSEEKRKKFTEAEHNSIQELAIKNTELKNARIATLNIIEDLSNEIEERKRAEEKLLHTQDQLIEAQRLTHSGSWEADFVTGKLSWSDEMYRIYGVDKESFGHTREALLELIHPEDRHILINSFKTNLSGKQNLKSHQLRIVHPDGSTHVVESSNRAYFDSNGKPIRVIGTTQDITERKNVEKELLIKEFAVESSVSAIGLADLYGKIIYVNNAYLKMWGYNDDKELLGREIYDFAGSKEFVDDVMMHLQSGKEFIGEGEARKKDGTLFNMMMSANLVTSHEGRPICAMASFVDITERKHAEATLIESEDRYRDLIENSSDLICTHDFDGNILSVNNTGLKIIGYSFDEALKLNMQNLLVPEYRRLFNAYMEKIKTIGHARGIMVIQTKSGERRIWEYNNTVRTQGVAKPIVRGMVRDITEQKKAQESLRESELRFKQVSENAREWIWEVDKNGLYTYASPVVKDILGYEPGEVVGKKYFYDFFDKKVREEIKQLAFEVFTRKDSFKDLVNINIHKDGREIILSTSGVPVLNERGNLLGYRGVDVDITERKHAEEKLQESETKYRLLFENNPHPMWVYDLETLRFLTVNNAAINKYGYSKEEFLSMTLIDIRPVEEITQLLENISESKDDLQRSGAWKHKLKDGTIIFVEIHSYKTEYDNKHARLVLANDITERKRAEDAVKESEEKFRKLAETASDSIVTIDSNGKIISWNKSAERTFGYTFDEINGKETKIILPDKYKLFQARTVEEQAPKGEPIIPGKTITVEAIRKDKSTFPIELSLSSWETSNSVYYTVIKRDISERVKVEHELETYRNNLEELVKARTDELDKANESLRRKIEKDKEIEMILKQSLEKEKELNEMKSRFISTTSHEFRTPLTSVLSSAELLQRYAAKWNDDKKNQHLNRIQKSVEYLTKLLDDVLTLSRTERGKISFNPEPVDLHKFAEECMEDVKSLLTVRHELNLNYNSRQEKFNLDPKLMKFIFNNMLSNAIKYSPDGGEIGLEISTDKKYLIMKVSDNGIGIAPEELGNIYEAFYRTKNIGTISGTGLGLAIVKHAVELHNGEISVSSEINKGTTFVIKIPKN